MDTTQFPFKRQWAGEIAAGDEVRSLFLVGSASQQQARNGPFWRVELRDATGSLEARIWSPLSLQCNPAAGEILEIEGRAESFRDRLQLNVCALRVPDAAEQAEFDLAAFMPSAERPAAEMLADLEALCRRVLTHKPWRTFVLSVLADPDIRPRLAGAPAAKGVHHAWAGGLLEHTLSVSMLCMTLADHYPTLDRQTLLAGAVCHDLGKLRELSDGLAPDYTDEGRLIGHINICLDMVRPHLEASGLDAVLIMHFRHLILSHHGQYEYGSPRLPQTVEALALHYADNLDAKVAQCRSLLEGAQEGGWSPFQNTLNRAVYLAPRTPEAASRKRREAESEPGMEQCLLLPKA